ncbi:MAG: hypothetical protein A2Z25_02500 [Planctomycetes bacterium RBG_16_55_9]|nr:MAG: hypothetical protein A2Z25_02500 [Planctomycetes bacterium RBG_16_55_9]
MVDQLCNSWWFFVVLGIGAGIVSGSLGLGSGTILVPVLCLVCGYGQKSAQGMALAVMVPMALLGAWRYWRIPAIDMNFCVIILVVCGALAGTLAGTELAARLPSHVLRKVFALFLVVIAAKMFVTPSKPKESALNNRLTHRETVNSTHNGGIGHEATEQ